MDWRDGAGGQCFRGIKDKVLGSLFSVLVKTFDAFSFSGIMCIISQGFVMGDLFDLSSPLETFFPVRASGIASVSQVTFF